MVPQEEVESPMPIEDLERAETQSQTDVRRPRTRSMRSWRSRASQGRSRTRTPSRPSTPDRPSLHRIFSAAFPDDHGTYVHPDDFARGESEQAVDDISPSCTSEKRTEDDESNEKSQEEPESPLEHTVSRQSDDRSGENAALEEVVLQRQPTQRSTRSKRDRDPNAVGWEGPDDPENPKNWPTKKKWAATLVVSTFTFISPLASTLVAPALPEIGRDLHIHDDVLLQMTLSSFILAYAIGPMFLGPLSEVYGRIPVLQLANAFFCVFNLACGFATNGAQLIILRFFAGLGGSAPLGVGGGVLADLFPPEQRGRAIAVYSLAPLLGPAIGPVAGGFVSEYSTYKWGFWAVSIACVPIQVSGLFLLQETWAPKVQQDKAKRLRKETGNEKLYAELALAESFIHKMEHSLIRPFKLLFTQPIVIALATYMAYLYGLVYLVISSFSSLYVSPKYYGESVGISGLHYIALGLGYFIGAQGTSFFNDWAYRRQKERNNGVGKPEFRIIVMLPCAILLPIGLLWYGWSAEEKVFWIVPDIGAVILAAATICGYQAIQTYVIDSYTKYAASAVAAISFLRSLAGFGFPLFAPKLYGALGYGVGNTVLAAVALAIGLPAPLFFWKYGEALRMKSTYAAGS